MFLIRTAFWLAIVILLLPTDAQQQSQVLGTAQAAVKDLSGFCGRNPDACDKGKVAFSVFVQKAQFGAHMLIGFVQNHAPAAEAQTASATEGLQPAPVAARDPVSTARDTLTNDDRKPAWSGAQAGT